MRSWKSLFFYQWLDIFTFFTIIVWWDLILAKITLKSAYLNLFCTKLATTQSQIGKFLIFPIEISYLSLKMVNLAQKNKQLLCNLQPHFGKIRFEIREMEDGDGDDWILCWCSNHASRIATFYKYVKYDSITPVLWLIYVLAS